MRYIAKKLNRVFLKKISLLVSLLFLCSVSTFSQRIKLDIKTTFEEKKNIAHIKAAVLECINQSDIFENVEFGEDYSLWLINYGRSMNQGEILIELDVELRSPAMITRGRLIDRKRLFERITLDEIAAVKTGEMSKVIQEKIKQISLLKENFRKVVASQFFNLIPIKEPFSILIGIIISKTEKETGLNVSESQAAEAIIISNEVLILATSMIPNIEKKLNSNGKLEKEGEIFDKTQSEVRETTNVIQKSENNKEKALGYFKLSLSNFKVGDIDKAIELSEKALEIEKTNGDIKANLGLFYLIKGNSNKAMEMYVEAVLDYKREGTVEKSLQEAIKNLDVEFEKNKTVSSWRAVRDYLQSELEHFGDSVKNQKVEDNQKNENKSEIPPFMKEKKELPKPNFPFRQK